MLPEIAKKIAGEITGTSFNHIEPVLGGRNSHIFQLKKSEVYYALKFFRTGDNNSRERFDAETSALKLFAENGIQCVPKIIAQDRENNCILLEWIKGEPAGNFDLDDINALSNFVKEVHEIAKTKKCREIRMATEACLNGNEIVSQINQRLDRLETAGNNYPELQEFLKEDFLPVFKKITDWSKEKYLKNGMDFDQDILPDQLTLSPVDIGAHNCLRTEDQLYFLDFEFFGRDDPVKLVADTLQHPGTMCSPKDNEELKNKLEILFRDDDEFSFRLNCLYPLFGLRWCMIMLNPFLSGYEVKDLDKNKVLKQQLFKVQAKTAILVKAIGNNLFKQS